MTGWVSAAEALRLLGEHRKDPKSDLIARAAAGAKTRAGGLWRDDQHIWENQPLNYRFWGAMRTHSTIQNWDESEFAYSVCNAVYPTSGRHLGSENHFEPDELLEWRATGVEFCWKDVAEALELGDRSTKGPNADEAFFEAWNTPERRQGWNIDFKPTERWIRDCFKRENPSSQFSLSKGQWRAVQDHFKHLPTRQLGRPKSRAKRGSALQ